MRTKPLMLSLAGGALAATLAAQAPVFSPEFLVNTDTTGNQYAATAANVGPAGNFVVVWNDDGGADGSGYGVRARMFDVTGTPLGGEFAVNATGTGDQGIARVGSNATGDFVVTFTENSTAPGAGFDVKARRFNSSGAPQGGDIPVNTFTTGNQGTSAVALDASGNFVVVWWSPAQDGSDFGVFGQLFDNAGVKVGSEFQVNEFTTGAQRDARVARRPTGEFLVVWRSPQDDQGGAVMARRFAANGTPNGGEFQVNTTEAGYQYQPDVAYAGDGSAIIAWTSYLQDGSNGGVYGQRLDPAGALLGPEFNVNTYTTGFQGRPSVAASNAGDGDFAIIWQSVGQDGSDLAVRAQHYDLDGRRLGVELPVNNITAGLQGAPSLAAQPNGQYVAVWDSAAVDGDASSVAARLAGFPRVEQTLVDVVHNAASTPAGAANLNGVFEMGEQVLVEPWYRNWSPDALTLTGTASGFLGPVGPTYTIVDANADYGTIPSAGVADCFNATDDCYQFSAAGPRPAQQHVDTVFTETLSYNDFTRIAALHIGGSFSDVPQNAFYPFIENLFHNGVTGGCAGGGYCPGSNVTRAQMAVFLLKSRYGAGFLPRPATGTVFGDVPSDNPFARWIEELSRQGVTGGCGGGNYCPDNPVTRQQMAVFLLKTLEGSTYVPDACAGDFDDVPCPSPFADWIEDLFGRGITGGCQASPPLYCPGNPNLRQQMAVFLVKTFGLQLYGE